MVLKVEREHRVDSVIRRSVREVCGRAKLLCSARGCRQPSKYMLVFKPQLSEFHFSIRCMLNENFCFAKSIG